MGLNEYEEERSKLDKRWGVALTSKVVDEIEDEEEDSEDEEIVMYARRFKRFIRKKKTWKKEQRSSFKRGTQEGIQEG